MQHFTDVLKLFDESFLSSDNLLVSGYFCERFTNKIAEDLSSIICVMDYDSTLDGSEGKSSSRIFITLAILRRVTS